MNNGIGRSKGITSALQLRKKRIDAISKISRTDQVQNLAAIQNLWNRGKGETRKKQDREFQELENTSEPQEASLVL